MVGDQFVTTNVYADSQVDVDREVAMHISTDAPVYIQVARINHRDGSRIWEQSDTPFPAADFTLDRLAGVRFKTNGGTPANVYVIWTFSIDDALVRRLSSNAPSSSMTGPFLPLVGGNMTGPINMQGNKITSLAAATAPGDALRYEQLFGANLFGGDLSGTFPNPVIVPNAVTIAKLNAAVTLDAIASTYPTANNVPMNVKKLTGLAAGTVNGDSVRFEQAIKSGDAAGGDLTGTYPNPTILANKKGTYPLTKLLVPVFTAVNGTAVGLNFSIPGGTLAATSVLRIRFCMTGSQTAGNSTLTLSLGGSTIKQTVGGIGSYNYVGEILMVCQNATNSQLWHYGAFSGSTVWWAGNAPISSALNMNNAQTLILSVSSSDVVDGSETMQYVIVEVEP